MGHQEQLKEYANFQTTLVNVLGGNKIFLQEESH